MGCDVRTVEQKAERFPGAKARVSDPYACLLYPTIQLLAKRLQDDGEAFKSATIVGGAIMSKTTCVTIGQTVCQNPP